MEKAIREGETGRVRGPFSEAPARAQGSQGRGKSLSFLAVSTCEAETVSGADCVVDQVGIELPTLRWERSGPGASACDLQLFLPQDGQLVHERRPKSWSGRAGSRSRSAFRTMP